MFTRVISLIGENNWQKLQKSHVLIVGLGGVGATAAESLVRSGIGSLTLIDYDVIDESNLNRQIMTDITTIGQKKTESCQKRFKTINPNCQINIIDTYLNKDNLDLLKTYDYIIDACDTIDTKVALINYAYLNNIKIISSMGTGKRINPSLLELTTLNKTYNDPLAKIMRKKLKDINIPLNKVNVVSSKELPLTKGKVLGSLMFVPSSAGLLIASFIIQDIIS